MEKLAMQEILNQKIIDAAMTYSEYTELLAKLLAQGKTTGENQSEELFHYAKMNVQRMKRLDKTLEITNDLKSIVTNKNLKKMVWLVITEGWCGDAAQNIPLLNQLATVSASIELKLILRDEHLEIMDQFLTNGGRSIPKLIVLDATDLKVLGTWGPRANEAQHLVLEFKKQVNGDYKEFVKVLQLWYAKDKTLSQQKEFEALIPMWANKTII